MLAVLGAIFGIIGAVMILIFLLAAPFVVIGGLREGWSIGMSQWRADRDFEKAMKDIKPSPEPDTKGFDGSLRSPPSAQFLKTGGKGFNAWSKSVRS